VLVVRGKSEKGGEWGPFERGGAYAEVDASRLGSLHEAWDVMSGQPVLQLLPTDRVEWSPEAPWRVTLLCAPEPTTLTVRVEEAPVSMPLSELANILVLTSSSVTRVEESARLREHLASGLPPSPVSVPRKPGRAALRTGLSLGLGLWLLMSLSESPRSIADLESDPTALAYPMPDKPLPGQALAPCKRNRSVVEINGGCWVELSQKPPCDPDTVEYQGKCYMPGSRPKKLPQSVDP
jgi:hypothetical protein